jgi:hypothetical protein
MIRPRSATTIGRTMGARLVTVLLVVAAGAAAVLALWPRATPLGAEDAATVAAGWVAIGSPQAPRGDGGEWEVDVARPDGSLVEVTVGRSGELLGFDEERGPGGRPAPDEMSGAARGRAVRAALAAAGPGQVLSAEREAGGHIEVGIRRPDNTQLEVGLDRRLRVIEIEREDPADE